MAIKLAGAGVITLETAIGIMAGGGAAVGGGTELANQVQSGEAVNPGAIATRTAFGGVKGALWGLAPELGAVGFGASIGGYSAVENLTYNAAKGKTTASDSIEAIAGGLGKGLFAGIMHKASSKVASKASESTPARSSEPIKPMTEAELEKVSGGAKDPGWRPNMEDTAKKFSPINPGRLRPDVAESFRGCTYTKKVLSEDTIMYRVYGEETVKVGRYLTRTPQYKGLQSQLDLALNPAWGNTAKNVIKVTVPKGTTVYEGFAAPQYIYDKLGNVVGELPGGGNQVYIPEVKDKWFK